MTLSWPFYWGHLVGDTQLASHSVDPNPGLLFVLFKKICTFFWENVLFFELAPLNKENFTRECFSSLFTLLQVRFNFDENCAGFHKLLMTNGELQKKIQGGEKWE
jgi:hypothetical protein